MAIAILRAKSVGLLVGVSLAISLGWWLSAPAAEVEIAGPVHFGPMDEVLVRLATSGEDLGAAIHRMGEALPGYDDVVVLADGNLLVSSMDGWIWQVLSAEGRVERWVEAPLMPAGLRIAPDDPDLIYFCSAHLHGVVYPAEERVGLYSVRRSTGKIDPIVLDVPRELGRSSVPQVFSQQSPARYAGTRPLAFCNDLDVSADGQRIYFSEPFAYAGASMGGGAVAEAISLGNHGRLWMHDRSSGVTILVARAFFFLDGVLIEPRPDGGREDSLLVTETTRFRIQRLFVGGARAGTHSVVWQNLPGMPDGLDRDSLGNVWVGLLGLRSTTTDWIHAHPWIKPLLLRLPTHWIPRREATGILALSPDMTRALYLGLHEGSSVHDVSVAIPAEGRIYLASFDPEQRGLVWIPTPDLGAALERADP